MLEEAKNTAKDYKWWIIGGLLTAVGLILYFYFAGRAAGKRAGSVDLSTPISDTGTGSTPSTGAFASEQDVRDLVGKIKADMTGANIWGHDNDTYKTLLSYSDTDFQRVNNEFNTEYQTASSQSLRQWLEAESSLADFQFNPLRDSILQRMDKLKII